MSPYFYKLSTQDNIVEKIQQKIFDKNSPWDTRRGFAVLKLPTVLFADSLLFPLIMQLRGEPTVFKMDPMTAYSWHIDTNRTCAINMLISGSDSHSFYGVRLDDYNTQLIELMHEHNKYFLVNTKQQHSVVNLNNMRYMLSIGFERPHTYESVLDECIKGNL
jgi:hypothetical protein